jgi:hypothetical protein
MARWVGADRSRVEVPNPVFSHGGHRVVDPADPPRELSGWAWGVYVSLGLVAILGLLRLFAALGLHSAVTGGGDVAGSYHDYSRWVGIDAIVFLVCAGVFITWFFQAYKNLRRLGVQDLRFGNGWAIGAWFVPILSLFRPKQIANDVWRGSERGADASGGWKQVPVPSLVHWWWGLFLTQGLLVYFGQQSTRSGYDKLSTFGGLGDGFSQIKTGTDVEVVGQLVGLAAVALAIMLVSQVTERLDQIREEASAQVPPPQYQAYPPPAPQYAQSQPPPPPPQYLQTPPPPIPPQPQAQTEQRIQCPECAEWIQAQANVCRFCGHRLRPLGQ